MSSFTNLNLQTLVFRISYIFQRTELRIASRNYLGFLFVRFHQCYKCASCRVVSELNYNTWIHSVETNSLTVPVVTTVSDVN